MMQGGHLAQALQVRGFAGEDVVGGNGLEGFSGKTKVHGVAGLGGEVDGEAAKHRVHRGNLAKTPTAMNAVTSGRKQN